MKNYLTFILINSGRFVIDNKIQYHSYGLHHCVCRTTLFWWNFPLHFCTFGALFRRYWHESSLGVLELTEEHQHKPYLSREPKEKSLEVLNRMISAANCNRRFEKSLSLLTFQAKDRWFRHLCGTWRRLVENEHRPHPYLPILVIKIH